MRRRMLATGSDPNRLLTARHGPVPRPRWSDSGAWNWPTPGHGDLHGRASVQVNGHRLSTVARSPSPQPSTGASDGPPLPDKHLRQGTRVVGHRVTGYPLPPRLSCSTPTQQTQPTQRQLPGRNSADDNVTTARRPPSPLITSTLYLPETTANVRHQQVPSRRVCAAQMSCPVMTGTVRWWLLGNR